MSLILIPFSCPPISIDRGYIVYALSVCLRKIFAITFEWYVVKLSYFISHVYSPWLVLFCFYSAKVICQSSGQMSRSQFFCKHFKYLQVLTFLINIKELKPVNTDVQKLHENSWNDYFSWAICSKWFNPLPVDWLCYIMAVGGVNVFPGFLTPVLIQHSSQSHHLLFSHALEMRGENKTERKFASNRFWSHNHQIMSQPCRHYSFTTKSYL